MALQAARTNLGSTFYSRIIFHRRVCTCGVSLISTCSGLAQRNASTTTSSRLKQAPATPKATEKAGNSSHQLPSRKVPTSKASPVTQRTSSSATPKPQKTLSKNAAAAKKHLEMTEEEREKELQRFLQMSEVMPTVDLFAQDQTTLGAPFKRCHPFVHTLISSLSKKDVMIPYPYDKSLPISRRFKNMLGNISNYFKNAAA